MHGKSPDKVLFPHMNSVSERGRPRKHCPAMHSRLRWLWPSWLVAPDFPVNYLTSGWVGGIISCSPSESVRNFDQLRSEVSRPVAAVGRQAGIALPFSALVVPLSDRQCLSCSLGEKLWMLYLLCVSLFTAAHYVSQSRWSHHYETFC